ncbi:MAG TPA: hypothetical protein VK149_03460 [Sideroxyarcus sp.]|nr:hypothetical protein [Sideroxyarcus sp.]
MNKIPVHNKTAMPMYVGATMILPGETRHFDEHEVPHHLRQKQEEEQSAPALNNPLADLLKGSVAEVVAALAGMNAADIERVGDLEQQGKARKGILSAIAEKLLNHAADERAQLIAAMSDEALAAALTEAGTDINVNPEYLAALEAEAAKRNPGATE